MRKIVIGGLVLGALVLAGCDDKSSGSGEAPAQSASATAATVPAPSASAAASPSASAKAEAPEKEKKAEGPKDHKSRVKAMEEAWASHDAKKVTALYAEDAVFKAPGMPDAKGRDAIEKHLTGMFAAFKDAKLTRGRVFEKDKHTIVVESLFTGTNTGDAPDMGIPKATNKPVGIMTASWYEIGDDGLIKEEHHFHDDPTFMGQLKEDKKNPVRPVFAALPDGSEHFEAKAEKEEAKKEDKKDDGKDSKAKKEEKKDDDSSKRAETEKKNVEAEDKMIADMNAGKIADSLKYLADDVSTTDYTQDKDLKGKKAFEAMIHGYLAAIPDMKIKGSGTFGDGKFVVQEFEYTGTQKGALGPIKPTNKPVDMHQLEIDEFKDGKIVKIWSWGNNMELLSELGVTGDHEDKKEKHEKHEKK